MHVLALNCGAVWQPAPSVHAVQELLQQGGQLLKANCALATALRDVQHWKWRAGLLQLQVAGREELADRSSGYMGAVDAELTHVSQLRAKDTAVIAALQVSSTVFRRWQAQAHDATQHNGFTCRARLGSLQRKQCRRPAGSGSWRLSLRTSKPAGMQRA